MLRNNNLNLGLNTLCDYSDKMFMNVDLLKAETGQTFSFLNENEETAFLLISGKLKISTKNNSKIWERDNCFVDDALCLHVSKNTNVDIEVLGESEVLIQSKENDIAFEEVWYDKTNIDAVFFGDGELMETTKRRVTTIIDKERVPYSNMVLGEIINFPGIWSSYPPHHHPQPEVYFYKFDKPQGFGTCFIGDKAYKITNNSIALIPGGKTHPQNAAPGYAMYYVWMIPHLKDNPWIKTRTFDPDHEWVNGTNLNIFKLKEK